MTLVNAHEIYRRARQEGYGIGGFCAENLDMILSILAAAEETRSPVVIVLWEADIRSVKPGYLESIVRFGAQQTKVPVAMMLDHGLDIETCLRSILLGHTAVMIDASHDTLERNIARTRQVSDIAHMLNVLVEGELGTVKRSFESEGEFSEDAIVTDPDQVADYVNQTGVDALSVSIGNESGVPEPKPVLDFERLRRIANSTHAYLVLHGGSGMLPEEIRQSVECGVTAFRFASELRVAYLESIVNSYQKLPKNYPDTRKIYEPARKVVTNMIIDRMIQLNCAGKAW